MIDAPRLLKDLKSLLPALVDDLRERLDEDPEARARLEEQYRKAKSAERTAEAFEPWRDEFLEQAAVAWILACVFVRFMEDNDLLDTPRISGAGERRQHAQDQHEFYFRHPDRRAHSDRDYLLDVFETVRALPAAAELFDPKHNPLWAAQLSGDGATKLLRFWRSVDPDTGLLSHNFTDPEWNTRFLGDLYQDLSKSARKRYALLQTPEFVEEFILDRTLTPAIGEFGFKEVRLIDPTCGSGHFLLGAFHRLFELWVGNEPGTNPRTLAQRALNQVCGVDLNPFAVAIARFRLLVAALKASGVHSLRAEEAPAFHVNAAAGDSLLHGRRFDELDLDGGADQLSGQPGIGHAFLTEDLEALNQILGQRYHAVVGNPPYITVKDRALNQLYRSRYRTCHRKYALSVPFTERFFELALRGDAMGAAGYVGMITANSFMKREFGKKFVEIFVPEIELTHVIDTSGAYIPGHDTPTVILFGRHRNSTNISVRTVMGIKGEPKPPQNASKGVVWTAIVEQLDHSNSESEWVGVADTAPDYFHKHPWSIGGGGVTELKELIDAGANGFVGDFAEVIGFSAIIAEGEAFLVSPSEIEARRVPNAKIREFVYGEDVRDWCISPKNLIWFPYSAEIELIHDQQILARLWNWRTTLWNRPDFSKKTYREAGRTYWEYHQIPEARNRTPYAIAFANVATGNHFVFDRCGRLFDCTALIAKLSDTATADDYLGLVGLLNSSVGCFWLKQVMHNKGIRGIAGGITSERWEQFYQFNGTRLKGFPLADPKPLDIAIELDRLATERMKLLPDHLVTEKMRTREELEHRRNEAESMTRRMIAIQEELDWRCYGLYGLTERDLCYRDAAQQQISPPDIELGERAFEIVMARQIVSGELETTWFERHGLAPITEIPSHWPGEYARLVERRIALIESDRNVGLIERPEYKRRWNQKPWASQEARALREWLLDRLEVARYWSGESMQTTARLSVQAALDGDFMQVAELYRGHADFDVAALVAELVTDESVPFLPVLCYKPTGLRKREVWERTWALQRAEDAIDAEVEAGMPRPDGESDEAYRKRLEAAAKPRKTSEVGDIPPPPKYRSADFLKTTYWRLRGALDVPKERFVSYPHCSPTADTSLLVCWAGRNPLQQAQALAAHYLEMKEREGWPSDRLVPLLAGLQELLPWVKQWHNDVDPAHGVRMGDYFEDFATEEARELGVTPEQIEAWTPPATTRRRGGKRRAAATTAGNQAP